ncbi:MAG: hypothetical protein QM654_00520 [Dysgonamonadaceae bacterium]
MYRRIIFICIFLCITLGVYSQSIDSLVDIKGYYITRFLKDEISFSYDQKIKRYKGESYSIPIDYSQMSFFIPSMIGGKPICNENITNIMSIEKNLNKDSIYFLPLSKQEEKYIKKISNSKVDLSKDICILSEVKKLSPYYIDRENDKYLYKIVFIDGSALQHTIPNQEKDRFPFYLNIHSVNKSAQFITLFFINNINSYSGIPIIEGLEEWFPYLNTE